MTTGQGTPEATRSWKGQGGILPGASGGSVALSPGLWLSALERTHFCFEPPSLCAQPQDASTPTLPLGFKTGHMLPVQPVTLGTRSQALTFLVQGVLGPSPTSTPFKSTRALR